MSVFHKDYYRLAEQQRTKAMTPDEVGDNVAYMVIGALVCALLWWFDVAMWTGAQ